MRSKTMLEGLCVFRCDRPSWESERTKKFAAWCIGMCQGNAVSMSARESAEWFVSRRRPSFFVLVKAKLIPMRIGSQTAWEAVRNNFVENRSRSRKRSLHPPRNMVLLLSQQFAWPS